MVHPPQRAAATEDDRCLCTMHGTVLAERRALVDARDLRVERGESLIEHEDGPADTDLMITFILLLLLALISWPLALLALLLYPIVWLLSIPLRLVGVSLSAVLEFVGALVRLPARLLRGPRLAR